MQSYKNVFLKCFFIWILLSSWAKALADNSSGVAFSNVNLGEISNNVFGVIMNVKSLLQATCLVSAAGLFVAALVKYKKHRQNPIAVSLGVVITNLVIAILLVVLAIINPLV